MTVERIAGVIFSIVITSGAATAQQDGPAVGRHDSTKLIPDLNGRLLPAETRSLEVREIGPSERLEIETVQRPDMSGNLAVSERNITRRSVANGREDVVIETYGQTADGYIRSNTPMGLSYRVRRSTTVTADGGRDIVEEEEGLSRVESGGPMRLLRRTLTTVRKTGDDRWVTERRIFERDVNGRMVPISTEIEEERD